MLEGMVGSFVQAWSFVAAAGWFGLVCLALRPRTLRKETQRVNKGLERTGASGKRWFVGLVLVLAAYVVVCPLVSYAAFRLDGVPRDVAGNKATLWLWNGSDAQLKYAAALITWMNTGTLVLAVYVARRLGVRCAEWFLFINVVAMYGWWMIAAFGRRDWWWLADNWFETMGPLSWQQSTLVRQVAAMAVGACVCAWGYRQRRRDAASGMD